MKGRIFVATVLLIFDVLLLPWLLMFIPLFIENTIGAPKLWLRNFTLFGISQVIEDQKFRLLWLISQGLVVVTLVFIFWRDVPKRKHKITGIGGPDAAGRGEHGTSRWQTEKEKDRTSTVWTTNKPLPIGGHVLGMEPYNTFSNSKVKELVHKVWLDTDDTHTLLLGASRSGKSRRVVLTTMWTLAQAGESMIMTDPKGELYQRSQKYLRSKGYKVVLLDFRDPNRGNQWNPMEPVNQSVREGDLSAASEVAWDLAQMFSPTNTRGERIWSTGTQSVLAATILAVAMEADSNEQKHLGSVYQMLIELGETIETKTGSYIPLNLFFEALPVGHIARSAYGTSKLAPDRQRGSFFTGAAAELRLWSDPTIASLTSTQDHIMENIGKEKTAVFLVIPDENTTRHILASLYINQAYGALIKMINQSGLDRLPIRTNYLLDEFGNLPAISDFDTKITVSLGRGIRFMLMVQGLDQLKKHYHESVKTIKGNCHTWIYLLTTDEETAEEISKKTGRYTIESENLSSTIMQKGYSQGFSSSTTGRALLDSSEVLRFPKDMALILRARQFPAILSMPDLSKWQTDKDFETDIDTHTTKRMFREVSYFIPGLQSSPRNEQFDDEFTGDNTRIEQDLSDIR